MTIVVAMGFVALLGPQGLLNSILMDLFGLETPPVRIANTLAIILLAHAFYNYAIVVRIVSAFWANLDPRVEETAKMLGAGRLQAFYHVTLPLLLPAIASSALLVFAFSFLFFLFVFFHNIRDIETCYYSFFSFGQKFPSLRRCRKKSKFPSQKKSSDLNLLEVLKQMFQKC